MFRKVLIALHFAGAALSIALYVGQNWTWNLLLNQHMGWGYPALLGLITAYGILRLTPELFFSRPPLDDSGSP